MIEPILTLLAQAMLIMLTTAFVTVIGVIVASCVVLVMLSFIVAIADADAPHERP